MTICIPYDLARLHRRHQFINMTQDKLLKSFILRDQAIKFTSSSPTIGQQMSCRAAVSFGNRAIIAVTKPPKGSVHVGPVR